MKSNFFMAIAISAITSLTINAQPQAISPYSGMSPETVRQVSLPENRAVLPGLNLNDQQREELKKINTEQLKERTQTRNLLREKRAKLEVLQTAEKPDMKAINKVIDEIAEMQAQEMKAQAANRQKIRNLLTEEQRAQYDARGGNFENMRTDGANRSRQQMRPDSDNFRGPRFDVRPASPTDQRIERPQRMQNERPQR